MTEPEFRSNEGSASDPLEASDIALVSFLRANASAVPEAGSGLEDRLMQAILQESASQDSVLQQSQARPRFNWRLVALIGVGLAIAGVGMGQLLQWFTSPRLSTLELAQLESFMLEGWDETVQPSESSTDWDWVEAKVNPGYSLAITTHRKNVSFQVTTYSKP